MQLVFCGPPVGAVENSSGLVLLRFCSYSVSWVARLGDDWRQFPVLCVTFRPEEITTTMQPPSYSDSAIDCSHIHIGIVSNIEMLSTLLFNDFFFLLFPLFFFFSFSFSLCGEQNRTATLDCTLQKQTTKIRTAGLTVNRSFILIFQAM